ncbi:hypothetical protein SAMN05216206_3545 [Pseudomonas guineae]|uniref:Uncharacterized protein n=1 Tax=Pseudomonas guineae TaxID=425504 RepID=A0A1I3P197_9PSED|nr:hypothetical protein [Pseudomonas guineae]SFJ15147.1 hypothetical protein SAMN05216206_3545 [Pseudomonas guineae]
MPIPREYLPFITPITVAIIAGSISFVVTILSKDQKTSEFRQAWIDALRSEISELLSISHTLISMLNLKKEFGETEEQIMQYFYSMQTDIVKCENLTTKIRLRLNPKEHKKLLSMLNTLEENTSNFVSPSENQILFNSAVIESQRILKKEWSRVKSGELAFRILKYSSLFVLIASLTFAALYANDHLSITYVP